ncbi:MAG: hypothetical protein P8010_08330 [Desulfosarcinaceae bacterium]|jgi:hypothetical protein
MLKKRKYNLSGAARARSLCAWGVLLVLLAGCATAVPGGPAPGPGALKSAPGSGWWQVHLHFNWPENTPPAMYLDLLAAREIFAPLIEAHRSELPLWRFHRRAARDEAGHRLRFLFYARPETARKINTALMAHPLMAGLHETGILERVVIDDPEAPLQANLAATSDPNWSPAMQASWPYFIMGVSQLWLNLMDGFAAGELLGPPPKDLPALIQYYKDMDDRMTATWRQEGRHALLHHLNALFGYERLAVYMRF